MIRNPERFAKRQEQRTTRRKIDVRMERKPRTSTTVIEVATQAANVVDNYNKAAYAAHLNAGGKPENFNVPLDGHAIVRGAVKRELKRTGRLDKFAKTYVSKD